MSDGDQKILKAVEGLYEAALTPDRWPVALDRIGDLLGQASVLLTAFDHQENVLGRSFTSRIAPYSLELFHTLYNTPESNPRLGRNYLQPVGKLVFAREVCDQVTFIKSGVYADCYRPEGLLDEVSVILHKTKTSMAGLAIMRQERSGPFNSEDISLIQVLIPHLQRAVQILSHIEKLSVGYNALSDALDHMEFGIILVRADGRVSVANRVAQDIARQNDGLSLSPNGLTAFNPAEAERLHRLIAAAIRQSALSGGTMSLSRPSRRRPLTLLICPLAERGLDGLGHHGGAAIFITDPERKTDAPLKRIAQVYGLTQREAALAILLTQGQDLREASTHLGVSQSTTQTHLKRILEKTGTHRQAEVVALILRSLAPIRTE